MQNMLESVQIQRPAELPQTLGSFKSFLHHLQETSRSASAEETHEIAPIRQSFRVRSLWLQDEMEEQSQETRQQPTSQWFEAQHWRQSQEHRSSSNSKTSYVNHWQAFAELILETSSPRRFLWH